MSDQPLSTRRQLDLMRHLQRLANNRQTEEERLAKAYQSGVTAAREKRENIRKPTLKNYERDVALAEDLDAQNRETQAADYKRVSEALRWEYQRLRNELEKERAAVKEKARKELNDGSWQIRSIYDAKKDQPGARRDEAIARVRKLLAHLTETEQAAAEVLASRLLGVKPEESAEETITDELPEGLQPTDDQVEQGVTSMQENADASRAAAQRLLDGWLSRLFDSSNFGVLLFAVFAMALAGVAWTVGFDPLPRSLGIGAAGGATATALLAVLMWFVMRPMARRQTERRYEEVTTPIHDARQTASETVRLARLRAEQFSRQLIMVRDRDLAELHEQVSAELTAAKAKIDAERQRIDQEYPERLKNCRQENEDAVDRLESQFNQKLIDLAELRDRTIHDCETECENEEQRLLEERDTAWNAMRDAWLTGCQEISSAFAQMRSACDRLFPNWSQTDFNDWEKPAEESLSVEFGRAKLDLASVKNGLPRDERLRPAETIFEIPALVTLTEQPSLLITAQGEARQRAVDMLQAVTLRFLTGQPPGKVRLTLLDPAGLGEGLSPFMHLADYEEDLIATRIWSESRDIDEQLQRLTSHMETVIQKYLRSEYDSIHEYNAQAGEVAEPFQLVVVSGFPNNFSDSAAKRLVSIATGGPRCGVYILGVIDARQRMPSDFNMQDLKADAVNLNWDAARAEPVWKSPAFEKLPLVTAKPPASERMVEVIRQAGAQAQEAIKVEVPFSVVTPQDEYWEMSCSTELRVPVGRAGANRLQDVRLGMGTSQHLLVAGKTGSGKSTFLHALITSAALHYSPDEVVFYLVDFKKGVEFKSYSNNRLPHARVVAIESEREFGLSVLDRLDQELTRRGELYRDCGAQNLADFRAANPSVSMPRILLVVDEFQELFVEDDRLAQESSLLMDRLVRQGRAFGIHVILGTQTLAGAYSIARSTLGQIAVRVALECSEADAHLILADERNQAARFLSRPGEAIYNDQNGLTSANEPFQVVWLPDAERADRLGVLDQYRESQDMPPGEMIVFEGNAPANLNTIPTLRIAPTESANAPTAYFGDAVAIKPPTHAEFGRHAGANLLVVGPHDESALGVLTGSVLSLAASSEEARFVVLDGSRPGEASEGMWERIGETLSGSCEVLDVRKAASGIASLAEEVTRREENVDEEAAPIYLVVWSGSRFRDLRKSEDDFSFSMDNDKPKSPDKHLSEILKNGPSVGVHVLIWCDGYNQAARMFDRSTMREFALRVAFQMSAADSSNLLDSPAATNLRHHRALFYSDETGESEKFRPYGPPEAEWLESLKVGSAVRTAE